MSVIPFLRILNTIKPEAHYPNRISGCVAVFGLEMYAVLNDTVHLSGTNRPTLMSLRLGVTLNDDPIHTRLICIDQVLFEKGIGLCYAKLPSVAPSM